MKYCSTCGAPAEDYAVACNNCRTPFQPTVNYQPIVYVKPKIPGRGFGISAMVLGIIGIVYSFFMFLAAATTPSIDFFEDGFIAVVLVYSVLPILSVSFAPSAIHRGYKNGVSISGLVLGILGLFFTLLSIIIAAA